MLALLLLLAAGFGFQGCASQVLPEQQPTPVDLGTTQSDEELLRALVLTDEPPERAKIAYILSHRYEHRSREDRYALVRQFVEAAAYKSARSALDTAGDVRSRRAAAVLIPAIGLDEVDALSAMLPLFASRPEPALATTANVLVTDLGAYQISPRSKGQQLEFSAIIRGVQSGRLPSPSPKLLEGSFITTTYAVHPAAAVNTWLSTGSSDIPKAPVLIADAKSRVYQAEYLREVIESADAAEDQETVREVTQQTLGLLLDLADEQLWPIQYYVYTVLVISNRFDDPRIAEKLRTSAVPMLASLREKDMSAILFPEQVAPASQPAQAPSR